MQALFVCTQLCHARAGDVLPNAAPLLDPPSRFSRQPPLSDQKIHPGYGL